MAKKKSYTKYYVGGLLLAAASFLGYRYWKSKQVVVSEEAGETRSGGMGSVSTTDSGTSSTTSTSSSVKPTIGTVIKTPTMTIKPSTSPILKPSTITPTTRPSTAVNTNLRTPLANKIPQVPLILQNK